MARSGGYGRVGGRRSGGGAWQWLLLGGLFGFGCAVIFVLTLLTLDVLQISDNAEGDQVVGLATNAPQTPATIAPTVDIQATINAAIQATAAAVPTQPAAANPDTSIPAETTEIPESAPVIEDSQPVTPDPAASEGADTGVEVEQTPDIDAIVAATVQAQLDAQRETAGGTNTDGTNTTDDISTPATNAAAPTPEIDPDLAAIRTTTVQIAGDSFQMGTTPGEVAAAVRECIDRDNGSCVPAYGEDSYPQVNVTLTDYAMEVDEVTNAQYVEFLSTLGPGGHLNGCSGRLCAETTGENENSSIIFDGLNYATRDDFVNQLPVVGVTWYGAQAYCEAIGRRLPTEAEWEYAAKGPNGNLYPWGPGWIAYDYARTSRPDPDNVGVVEIGSFPQDTTTTGILDMAGNAAEWVADWYDSGHYSTMVNGVVDPTGPAIGRERVYRGGSWEAVPFFTRTVHRRSAPPEESALYLGFRCAEDPQEQTTNTGIEAIDTDTSQGVGPDTEALTDTPLDAAPTLPPLELPDTAGSNASATSDAPAVPPVPPGG